MLTSTNGVHVGFRGGCREEQELGKLRGIDGGVDGSIFGGALPRRIQYRIQHRSQRRTQQLLRLLTPRLIAHQPATRRNPRAGMLMHQVADRRQPQRIRGRRLIRRQVARHRVAVLHAHGGTRLIAEIAHVTATQTRGQTGCRRGIRVHARCAGERRLQLGERVFPARLSRRTRRIHAQGRQLRRDHAHIRGNRHGRLLARGIQPEGILGTTGQQRVRLLAVHRERKRAHDKLPRLRIPRDALQNTRQGMRGRRSGSVRGRKNTVRGSFSHGLHCMAVWRAGELAV